VSAGLDRHTKPPARGPLATLRRVLRRCARVVLAAIAIIYLVVDALFLAAVRPLSRWLSRWPVLARLRNWVAAQNRYVALALVFVPLLLLEPLKPLSVYLIAKKQLAAGAAVLVGGEMIKIVLVERMFQIAKPKLLTFIWFARGHDALRRWIGYLTVLPVTQAVLRRYRSIRTRVARWKRAAL
jgi:hypothetical protein